ncbi:MAG TPA: DUF2948 family protein [Stellaceae bacterium]|nr:DUF2948 family protein [Stellaceae bacterium]
MNAVAPEPPPSGPGPKGLRLRAVDAEDLAVISACLQDALVSVRDIAYDLAARSFVLVANRLRWENCGGMTGPAGFERTLCGLEFDEIDRVAYRGFRRSEEDRILSLLAIQPAPPMPGSPAVEIEFEFAAGATLRIAATTISCRARDFGEPWPTRWLPDHALDDGLPPLPRRRGKAGPR